MLANLLSAGADLDVARAAVILVHGRGASAGDILAMAGAWIEDLRQSVAFLAPQAPGGQWYPYSFLAPIAQNEPDLSHSLQTLADLFATLEQAGLGAEKTLLAGFSQGASLSLTYAARNPRRYGGVAGLSGGIIGPPGEPWHFTGTLALTPVFLGCSDVDPFIPKERVVESARELEKLGAQVTARLYPGMAHTVNDDEIKIVGDMLRNLAL